MPTLLAAEQVVRWAQAMFLEEPVSNAMPGPISCQTGGLRLFKHADPLCDFFGNGEFGLMEGFLEFLISTKFGAWFKEVMK